MGSVAVGIEENGSTIRCTNYPDCLNRLPYSSDRQSCCDECAEKLKEKKRDTGGAGKISRSVGPWLRAAQGFGRGVFRSNEMKKQKKPIKVSWEKVDVLIPYKTGEIA